ncbi:spartin isoform X1 [Lates japonicus]|uniref:Spartin isoform X1 n=1 Tax=Lates japonicus TaxID=270547 RepID=A0AAD3QWX7_LATJO|nr:spartin isoform X1 [Lates japonicus]
MTAYNIDNLGIKAILKTTGKATAKVMVKSPDGKSGAAEREEEQTQENQVKTEEKEAQKKEEEEKKK